MKFRMVHQNFNVRDAEASAAFYAKALGLHEVRRHNGKGFLLIFMADDTNTFQLELTQLFDHPQAYDLGENEIHLALAVADYQAAYEHHKQLGCICYENTDMGIYFIEDPDGYWLEIVHER